MKKKTEINIKTNFDTSWSLSMEVAGEQIRVFRDLENNYLVLAGHHLNFIHDKNSTEGQKIVKQIQKAIIEGSPWKSTWI